MAMTLNESEIQFIEEELCDADESPEPDTSEILDKYLADDLVMIGPAGQLVSKAFILEGHRPPKKQAFEEVKLSERIFKDLGENHAVTCCRADYKQKDKAFALRFFRVWGKIDGQWKLSGGTVTAIPPG